MHPELQAYEPRLARFCQAHHIRRLALFGSRLRRTQRPDSDIDLLVAFDAAHTPTLLGISAMETELSSLLGGAKVDLRTAEDLSRHFRHEVLRTAQVQVAA